MIGPKRLTMTEVRARYFGTMFYALAHATVVVAKQPVYRCTLAGERVEVRP